MIKLDRVTKQYGSKTAVHELNLDIPPGELFAFLGPNGAGKTTTIKMMCGLLYPTSGTVLIGGHDLRRDGDRARQLLSYVPDQPFLYEKLTGREFLQFIADMYGLPRDLAQVRITDVIEQFELHEFVDDLTERYSHGMRQRTVFASALVHEPQVLIVDEPTVGLDPHSVRRLKDSCAARLTAAPRFFCPRIRSTWSRSWPTASPSSSTDGWWRAVVSRRFATRRPSMARSKMCS